MAAAANAAAAAAIGLEEPGPSELTTTERLEPVSNAGPAAAPEPLPGMAEASQAAAQPAVDHGASAADQLVQSKVAELRSGASLGPSTSAPAGADNVCPAEKADQHMQDASQAAAGADAVQGPEQMTQACPMSPPAGQPPKQLTQAYPGVPMEVDGARVEEQVTNAAASMAQRAEHVSAATAAPSTAQPNGKPMVAGLAIFTKVSPMKGKVGLLTMPACMHRSFKRAFQPLGLLIRAHVTLLMPVTLLLPRGMSCCQVGCVRDLGHESYVW